MSFGSIFKGIGKGLTAALGVEHQLAPMLSLIPGFGILATVDSFVTHIQGAIVSAEAIHGDGQGAVKSTSVIDTFNAGLEIAQDIARTRGKVLAWDTTALQAAINAQVEAYNQFAKVKASFREVDPPQAEP